MGVVIILFIFATLIALGYLIGSKTEENHFRSIEERETRFASIPVLTSDLQSDQQSFDSSWLVSGSVVISIDYFKRIAAGLKNIIGGQIHSYESVLERGRREAILRMKENAGEADLIVNLRIETSSVSQDVQDGSVGSIEVHAYGTAVKVKK